LDIGQKKIALVGRMGYSQECSERQCGKISTGSQAANAVYKDKGKFRKLPDGPSIGLNQVATRPPRGRPTGIEQQRSTRLVMKVWKRKMTTSSERARDQL